MVYRMHHLLHPHGRRHVIPIRDTRRIHHRWYRRWWWTVLARRSLRPEWLEMPRSARRSGLARSHLQLATLQRLAGWISYKGKKCLARWLLHMHWMDGWIRLHIHWLLHILRALSAQLWLGCRSHTLRSRGLLHQRRPLPLRHMFLYSRGFCALTTHIAPKEHQTSRQRWPRQVPTPCGDRSRRAWTTRLRRRTGRRLTLWSRGHLPRRPLS